MSDYLTLTCQSGSEILPIHTDPKCKSIDGEIAQMIIFAVGTDPKTLCIQDATAINALITAGKAAKISIVGDKPDATPNEVDDPWLCGAGSIIVDYTESFSFSAKFWKDKDTGLDNYPYWNTIRNEQTIGGLGYLSAGGLVHVAQNTKPFTVSIDWDRSNNNILGVKGTITWRANDLDKPFFANSAIFSC